MQHVIIILWTLLVSTACLAVGVRPGAKPTGYDANGNPIYKLLDIREDQNTTVYRGTKSVAGEFPELGFLGFCTATAVGPNLIYTAAHCVANGQRVRWKMRKTQVVYNATCSTHPKYNDQTVFNDYAFCILDVKLPDDAVFASFNTKGSPAKGDDMLLNGYGDPNLGTHFWGRASVYGISGQDIITCGPANLGGGDSGGPFFKWTTDRTNPRKHIIDGTNSRTGGGCSYFNSTSHPNFKPYAESVAEKSGTYICGVTKDCSEPEDPNKCKDERAYKDYIAKQMKFADDALKMCLSLP